MNTMNTFPSSPLRTGAAASLLALLALLPLSLGAQNPVLHTITIQALTPEGRDTTITVESTDRYTIDFVGGHSQQVSYPSWDGQTLPAFAPDSNNELWGDAVLTSAWNEAQLRLHVASEIVRSFDEDGWRIARHDGTGEAVTYIWPNTYMGWDAVTLLNLGYMTTYDVTPLVILCTADGSSSVTLEGETYQFTTPRTLEGALLNEPDLQGLRLLIQPHLYVDGADSTTAYVLTAPALTALAGLSAVPEATSAQAAAIPRLLERWLRADIAPLPTFAQQEPTPPTVRTDPGELLSLSEFCETRGLDSTKVAAKTQYATYTREYDRNKEYYAEWLVAYPGELAQYRADSLAYEQAVAAYRADLQAAREANLQALSEGTSHLGRLLQAATIGRTPLQNGAVATLGKVTDVAADLAAETAEAIGVASPVREFTFAPGPADVNLDESAQGKYVFSPLLQADYLEQRTLTTADGQEVPYLLATGGSTGSFSVGLEVPRWMPAGEWEVEVTLAYPDLEEGDERGNRFEVYVAESSQADDGSWALSADGATRMESNDDGNYFTVTPSGPLVTKSLGTVTMGGTPRQVVRLASFVPNSKRELYDRYQLRIASLHFRLRE